MIHVASNTHGTALSRPRVFSVLFTLAVSCISTFAAIQHTSIPVDDTFVRAGTHAKRNFGVEPFLELHASKTSPSEVFLKFDIRRFDMMSSSAKLRVYAAAEKDEPTTILVRSSSSDWLENTMTWKDKPEPTATVGTIELSGSLFAWYEVDVTSLIRTELAAANNTVTLSLIIADGNNKVAIKSRESDSNRPELIAERNRFTAKIAFRPGTSPSPPGYLVDSGEAFGLRTNGFIYGWSTEVTRFAYDRNIASDKTPKPVRSPDMRYAGTIFMDHPEMKSSGLTWQLAVPNGTYKVHLVAGDASYYDSVFALAVEGNLLIDSIPDVNKRWAEGTQMVAVKDNRLTVSNHSKSVNNKVCFIEIAEQVDENASAGR